MKHTNSNIMLCVLASSIGLLTGCVAPATTTTANANTANTTTPATAVQTGKPVIGAATVNSVITTGMGVGKTVFQTAVNAKCMTEIEQSKFWQTSKALMTADRQTQVKYNICGCVSQQAGQMVTLDQLIIVAANKDMRNTMVANTVANSLDGCYSQVMQSIVK